MIDGGAAAGTSTRTGRENIEGGADGDDGVSEMSLHSMHDG